MKGEKLINMLDVNEHFVKPWTRGTGCSLAVLMSGDAPRSLVLSHSSSGSVVETTSAIESLLRMHALPHEARLFFSTFCMYECEDGHADGLSTSAQVEKDPIALIIESHPRYGMYVLHTTGARDRHLATTLQRPP